MKLNNCLLLWILGIITVFNLSLSSQSKASPTGQINQLPTATEIFNLRSECTKLAEKLLKKSSAYDRNYGDKSLSYDQVSNYNPEKNRCFVELAVHPLDISKVAFNTKYYLYDGQTSELLAVLNTVKGQYSGNIFDQSYLKNGSTQSNDNGWSGAHLYIDEMMG